MCGESEGLGQITETLPSRMHGGGKSSWAKRWGCGETGNCGKCTPCQPRLEHPLLRSSTAKSKHQFGSGTKTGPAGLDSATPLVLDNARHFLSVGGTTTQPGTPEGMCIPGKEHRQGKCILCNQKRSLGHLIFTFFPSSYPLSITYILKDSFAMFSAP